MISARKPVRVMRVVLAAMVLAPAYAVAQNRLPTMPGYDNCVKMAPVYQQNQMTAGVIGGRDFIPPLWQGQWNRGPESGTIGPPGR
jgi:hypothetical protein